MKLDNEAINPVIAVVMMAIVVFAVSVTIYFWTHEFAKEKQVESSLEKIILESVEGTTAYIRNLSKEEVVIDKVYADGDTLDVHVSIPQDSVGEITFTAERNEKVKIVTKNGAHVVFRYTKEGTQGANIPPVADANGPYSVLENGTTTLDGTASSDADGSISSYSWQITNDPTGNASLTNADTATPTFHAPGVSNDTNVTVELTVTDNEGANDAATTIVTVVNNPWCPHLYAWNGEGYQFETTMIPNSFLNRYESMYYQMVSQVEPRNGYYNFILFEPFEERAWINYVGLTAVDHPQTMEIVAGRSGKIYAVENPQSLCAVDSYGRNITGFLQEIDGRYWTSDLSRKDLQEELTDSITLTLPETDNSHATLLIAARDSNLPDLVLWSIMHYLLGTPNQEYVIDQLEQENDLTSGFDEGFYDFMGIQVQYYDEASWHTIHTIYPDSQQNPFDRVLQAVTIDLDKIKGNKLRLFMSAGMCEIDYIAMDCTNEESLVVKTLPLTQALKHGEKHTWDILDTVTARDDAYCVFNQGEYIHYAFEAAPLEPLQDGYTRSFIVSTGGYYYLLGPKVPENKIYNVFWAKSMARSPSKFLKWIFPRYMHPESYHYTEYYHPQALSPPFDTDRDSE